ncbi:chitin disaccharide deacetylase [Virgibacillus sp. 179-BFC.A HS]|uniref:Chitin disaccharide deacetylase n=1 Tax=Tigheibacillus jepli TaxID=3035914 RepID=A0ABU5CE32_9BACI|nr:chitin disaccharide deacetylase [Virgibacillus sp. 179-BFC.A HS]MDY0404598.1 chitin disaccharide deacetylase [Virgibacillus sp. 179-BFC.A HS]
MKVLFNADDFGLTAGVTQGIIRAHIDGLVRSATLMMNGLAVDEAVTQAKKHPSLQVGVHLVLTWNKPLSAEVPDLIDETGHFRFNNTFASMPAPNLAQVEKEWRTQIEAFLATGLPLHHIDSHHHVHGWEVLKDIVIRLAQDYRVPVRFVDTLKDHPEICLTDALFLDFYGDGVREDIFDRLARLEAETVEVMTHPAFVDEDLRKVSSYTDKRQEELALLTTLPVPDGVEIMRR